MMTRSLGYVVQGVEHGGFCRDLFEEAQSARLATGLPVIDASSPPGEGWPCDVILLDGSMPVMTGPQTAAHLRGMGVRIPIIAVT